MIVIFSILLGLLILRLLLPFVAVYVINRILSRRIKGYQGNIDKIDINLFRGRYCIRDIVLRKNDPGTSTGPFFTASAIDLLVQWKALFNKSIVATIVIEQPEINFVKEKPDAADETKSHSGLKATLQKTTPFKINLGIKGGTINYTDTHSKAHIDVDVTNVAVCVHNLSNMPAYESTPAHITASAHVYEGTFDFTMKLFPMAEHLTFDMNTELQNVNLVLLNEFFRTYAKIDVNRGTFDMYTEVAANDGGFTGYVTPVIKDLDIIGVEDQNDSLFRKIWERVVAGAYQLIKNKREDQIAAKIPIEGKFEDPHINIFAALASIFQNAFAHVVHPSMEDVINLTSVGATVSKAKRFVNRIFKRDKAHVAR